MKTYTQLLNEKFHGDTDLGPPVYWGRPHSTDRLHRTLSSEHQYGVKHGTSVRAYTDDSSDLNEHLHETWKKSDSGYDPSHHTAHQIPELDAALKQHKAPEDFHVYTGLRNAPLSSRSSLKPLSTTAEGHHKVVLPAYTSTSLQPRVAEGFAVSVPKIDLAKKEVHETKHMLKIHIPKGSKHGGYVGHEAHAAEEREFVMRRGTQLHIHPIPEKHFVDSVHNEHSGETTHHSVNIWHAKVVGNHYD